MILESKLVASSGPTYSWKVGAWSYCSKGCDGGTRTRAVRCGRYLNGELVGEEEDISKCKKMHSPKPPDSERCQLLACGEDYAHVILVLDIDLALLAFSGKALSMFVQSFVAEISGSLFISESRIMVSSVFESTPPQHNSPHKSSGSLPGL